MPTNQRRTIQRQMCGEGCRTAVSSATYDLPKAVSSAQNQLKDTSSAQRLYWKTADLKRISTRNEPRAKGARNWSTPKFKNPTTCTEYFHRLTCQRDFCFNEVGIGHTCMFQRTENRARKMHVFASVCSQVMKGRGGVGWGWHVNVPCASSSSSATVHAATLHRCLAVLLRCIHEGVGWGVGGGGENQLPHWNNRCRMECCQRLHPQLVVFKEQRSSPLFEVLAVEICESAYPSPAKNNFNAEAPALKSLKRKKKPVKMPHWNESKTHKKANFAKFSRENLAQFGLQKCLFRYGKHDLF